MKFSLRFLVFLLIWAALITNGWILQIRNNSIAEELTKASKQSEKISISDREREQIREYEQALTQTDGIRKFHSNLIAAVNEARYQTVELNSVDAEFAKIGYYRFENAEQFARPPTAYKVSVPGDRSVLVVANLKQSDETASTKSFQLQPGEYDLLIHCDKEGRTSSTIHVRLESQKSSWPEVSWEFPLGFYANSRRGGGQLRGGITELRPGKSLVLFNNNFRNSSSQKSVDMEISIKDKTEDDKVQTE